MISRTSLKLHRFLIGLELITLSALAFGQPAPRTFIDPFDTCNQTYRSDFTEYIFVGEVIKFLDDPEVKSKNLIDVEFKSEATIKGSLDGENVMTIVHYEKYHLPEVGKKYIFTGRLGRYDQPKDRIVSNMWSYEVQDLPDELLSRIVEKIRNVSLGNRQAQIEGVLITSAISPSGVRKYSPEPKMIRLVFDSQYSVYLPNAEVEITSESGRRFVTKTDGVGWFTFDGIPPGNYRMRPLLPHAYEMSMNGSVYSTRFNVDVEEYEARKCGSKAVIGVTNVGNFSLELDLSGKGITGRPWATLYPVNPDSGEVLGHYPEGVTDIEFDSTTGLIKLGADRVPIGHYILQIGDKETKFYYPETDGISATDTIKVGL